MKLRILGCSGGIGGRLRTTSMLLDHDVLIDAGTGVGDLSITELAQIDHIFLTHSHLDHIASIPFLVDTVGGMRSKPLTVYASDATRDIIVRHIFNWNIWPDFTRIPSVENPYLRFESVSVGTTITLGARRFTVLPAEHTVPAVGYHLDSGSGSLVFTGDTIGTQEFWDVVNRIENLRYLIIETAFCNFEKNLATASKHLCPSTLAIELSKLHRPAEIYITHLKPGEVEQTMQEIEQDAGEYKPIMLENNMLLEF